MAKFEVDDIIVHKYEPLDHIVVLINKVHGNQLYDWEDYNDSDYSFYKSSIIEKDWELKYKYLKTPLYKKLEGIE